MKAIMLMFDSLNRHMLSSYGCNWTHTPNFARLAERTVTFDNCYAGSLPCIPARRELHTGRYNFLHRAWGPLEPFDDSMPEILRNQGIYTHLISDHGHYWEDGGATYHQRYNTWEIIRGQEGDRWKGHIGAVEEPEHYGRWWKQDEINRMHLATKEDMPLHKVYAKGIEFLEENAGEDQWFLQLEAFDPHEPFFSAQEFKNLYPHKYEGPRFDWPEYTKVTEPDFAVQHCRYEYAALLSACDYYLGMILDYMDIHNMWEDTMLIVNTDHGFLLSEHDCWAKCVHPFYNEIAHVPLYIWDPRISAKGERRNALVQNIDLAPTILEYFGVSVPKDMKGIPLKETIRSDISVRDYALFGIYGGQINITDGRYVYMRDPNGENWPLYEYTMMPTHMRSMFSVSELQETVLAEPFSFTKGIPVLKIASRAEAENNGDLPHGRFGTRLYDLKNDPGQIKPIQNFEVEERMKVAMAELMRENDAPEEQYERLGLNALKN